MKIILAIVLAMLVGACSDSSTARKVLLSQGYTQIELTGWKMLGCGQDDMFVTGFKAVGPAGHAVSGVVCSSLFKGATVRTF